MYSTYFHKRLTDLCWILLSLYTESQRSANFLTIQNFGHPRLIGSFSCQPEGKISNHPMLRIRQACTPGAVGWVRGELQKEAICFGPSEGSKTIPRPPTHSYSLTKWSWRCLQVTLDVSLTAGWLSSSHRPATVREIRNWAVRQNWANVLQKKASLATRTVNQLDSRTQPHPKQRAFL